MGVVGTVDIVFLMHLSVLLVEGEFAMLHVAL